jgi:myo-inositol-1(or 4)-monophosphatase
MSQALHPMLNTAIKAARSAGAIINRASLDLDILKVNTKSPNDFVTEVDHKAEAVIIETLLGAYPGHGILAEESGREHGAKDSEFVWIIDPLDGTTNFIHGFPVYCVSIALAHRGQVQQAVVYDPTRNDLFYASKGRGAFLNDRRLRVSKRTRLTDCLVSTGFPFRKGDNFKRYMQMMEAVMPACAGLRRPGSAALDLCYVAAGYTDGFFENGLSPWDIAAGSLMVTEAGGLIGNFTGEADYLYQRECLAASPRIYGQLVALLQPFTHVIAADAAVAPGETTVGITPEDALAAGVKIERDPSAPAPVKKVATRISKESMAAEKQAAAEAERKSAPRPRAPRGGDAPF